MAGKQYAQFQAFHVERGHTPSAVKTFINGVKFTPSEMEIIFKALDLKESNAGTVAAMYDYRAEHHTDRDHMSRKELRQAAKKSRLDESRASSAQQKWHRVCLGWTDEYYAEIEARRNL